MDKRTGLNGARKRDSFDANVQKSGAVRDDLAGAAGLARGARVAGSQVATVAHHCHGEKAEAGFSGLGI
jgi:hypothetical protein